MGTKTNKNDVKEVGAASDSDVASVEGAGSAEVAVVAQCAPETRSAGSAEKVRSGAQCAPGENLPAKVLAPVEVPGRAKATPSKFWRKGSLERRRGAESDSDSASGAGPASSGREGVGAAAENEKTGSKRPRPKGDRGSSSNEEAVPDRKKDGQGKGRGGARRLWGAAAQRAAQRAARLAEEGRHPAATGRRASSVSSDSEPNTAGVSEAQRLKSRFAEAVKAAVNAVAWKRKTVSKIKAISDATASILAAAEACNSGPPSDEVSELRADVARLTAATELLRNENEKLRADLTRLQGAGSQGAPQEGRKQAQDQPAPVDQQVLDLVRQELTAFRERFSVLEGIVLRPPLAASRTATASGQKKAASFAAAVAAKPAKPAPGKPAPAEPAPGKPATAKSAPGKPAPTKSAPGKPAPAKPKKGGAAAQAAEPSNASGATTAPTRTAFKSSSGRNRMASSRREDEGG